MPSKTRILPRLCQSSTLIMPPKRPPKWLADVGPRSTLQDDTSVRCLIADGKVGTCAIHLSAGAVSTNAARNSSSAVRVTNR
jgi:hypothetical protein